MWMLLKATDHSVVKNLLMFQSLSFSVQKMLLQKQTKVIYLMMKMESFYTHCAFLVLEYLNEKI